MMGINQSIIEPQKVAPVDKEMPEDHFKKNMSPRQKDFNPHPATGAYSSLC